MGRQAFAGLVLGLIVLASPARAVILDFDATSIGAYLSAPYDEDGFRITLLTEHYDFLGPPTNPTNFINIDDYAGFCCGSIRLTRIGGGSFDLLGLDIVLSTYVETPPGTSGYCLVTCTISSSNGGLMANLATGTLNFSGPAWTNLAWVDFKVEHCPALFCQTSLGIDNINVAAIPLPGAAWLFGAAVGLLGVSRRRAADAWRFTSANAAPCRPHPARRSANPRASAPARRRCRAQVPWTRSTI